ncbi:erv1/alr family domain-containing protein [Ceratobasidium sp. AG-Ba]|nr:erv1/alr family domain-containing protein [Ceratobasidium sp. AG-Ba]
MPVAEEPKPSSPGVTIGPDGKPCRACNSLTAFTKAQRSSSKKNAAVAGLGAASAASGSLDNCPADSEQLGRATWTFLHTAAAYYPERPSQQHQWHMLSLLRALPSLYPCSYCAKDFGRSMEANPPEYAVLGRDSLSRWLCERHNEVNLKLGKEKFDCGISNLDARWKDGPADGSCN